MKILPVFICEDNESQLMNLKMVIENHIMINDMAMSLKLATADPVNIVDYLETKESVQGVYFLDIDLGTTMDGIELAQIIREKDTLAKIIFITTHDELAPLTLQKKVEPLGYVSKDSSDMKNQLIECLDLSYQRYVDGLGVQKKLLTFSIAKKKFNIDLNTVVFLEVAATPHKIILYTDLNQYEFYGKLGDYEREYPELFRCHKAYLINPKKIESIDFKKREIYFEQELSCLFSAIKKKSLERMCY